MKRASPVEHTVHQHTRKSKKTRVVVPVHKYVRGDGVPSETPFLFKKKSIAPESYSVKITYGDGKSSRFTVVAEGYRDALDKSTDKATGIPVSYQLELK